MEWFYLVDQKNCGPVSDEQVERLRRNGVINGETLVWRSGMEDWKPLRTIFVRLEVALQDFRQCVECQKLFPQADMITLSRAWVCSGCKPTILQRMAEGIAPAPRLMWRDGDVLVTAPETPFPDRCIRCNASGEVFRIKCPVQYAPRGRFVLSPTRAIFLVGLCAKHRKWRRISSIITWAMALGGLGLMFTATNIYGFFLIILAAICSFVVGRPVSVRQMKDGMVWVHGAGKPFLAELPQWTGGAANRFVP